MHLIAPTLSSRIGLVDAIKAQVAALTARTLGVTPVAGKSCLPWFHRKGDRMGKLVVNGRPSGEAILIKYQRKMRLKKESGLPPPIRG